MITNNIMENEVDDAKEIMYGTCRAYHNNGNFFPPARAEAIDAWGIAAQALGVLGAYHSALGAVLALGNDVNAQVQSERQDIAENGRTHNVRDTALIDTIMQRLVRDGDYVLRVNSLPFTWAVTDSSVFNAACYPTDYVSINRGLIRGRQWKCGRSLPRAYGHEMTHGIRQHSAHNYARRQHSSTGSASQHGRRSDGLEQAQRTRGVLRCKKCYPALRI